LDSGTLNNGFGLFNNYDQEGTLLSKTKIESGIIVENIAYENGQMTTKDFLNENIIKQISFENGKMLRELKMEDSSIIETLYNEGILTKRSKFRGEYPEQIEEFENEILIIKSVYTYGENTYTKTITTHNANGSITATKTTEYERDGKEIKK
jgi:hypothetical protein